MAARRPRTRASARSSLEKSVRSRSGSTGVRRAQCAMTAECATAQRDTASRSRTTRASPASPYCGSGASATMSQSPWPAGRARGRPVPGSPAGALPSDGARALRATQ